MLEKHAWIRIYQDLEVAMRQAAEEGKDPSGLLAQADAVKAMPDGFDKELAAMALCRAIEALPIRAGYPYEEPSGYREILRSLPAQVQAVAPGTARRDLTDRFLGAWEGRIAGCLLGKPVEGKMRAWIRGVFGAAGNYPIRDYLRAANIPPWAREKWGVDADAIADCVDKGRMPPDDDTNYTVLGLLLFEHHGGGFTTENVAENWYWRLPAFWVATGERISYCNVLMGLAGPGEGLCYNHYREWLSAQIRADFYGYAAAGYPEAAAEFAYRDACFTHTENGIYGAMWVAAVVAAAAVSDDVEAVLQTAAGRVPPRSRLAEGLRKVFQWHGEGLDIEAMVDRIHAAYDEANGHDWCHTVPNVMIIAASLLCGRKDFGKTVGSAVGAGFDTDCNGATAGSILGMMLGASGIPARWRAQFGGRLATGIAGLGEQSVDDLAKRTRSAHDSLIACGYFG